MSAELLADEPHDPTPEEHQENLAFIQSILSRKVHLPEPEEDPPANSVMQSLVGRFIDHVSERTEVANVTPLSPVEPVQTTEMSDLAAVDPNLPGLLERWKKITANQRAEPRDHETEDRYDRPSVIKRAIGK